MERKNCLFTRSNFAGQFYGYCQPGKFTPGRQRLIIQGFPNFIVKHYCMARIKIELPKQFHFSCEIPVRITDINYGGHVGNDTILSIIHEARMQFFKHFGYSEMQFAGVGIILADAGIEFKAELFYGDTVIAYVTAGEFSKVSFDVFYRLEKQLNDKMVL